MRSRENIESTFGWLSLILALSVVIRYLFDENATAKSTIAGLFFAVILYLVGLAIVAIIRGAKQ